MDNSRKGKKNKVRPGYGINDYYNFFKKKSKHDIPKDKFRKILKEFNEAMIKEIVLENYEFKLPYRLGTLGLRKFKPKLQLDKDNKLINHNPPDFKKTRELWEKDPIAREKKILVRHLNKHTNGYIFEIRYFTKNALFKNKTSYKFTPVRKVNQFINKATRNYNIDALIR